MPVVDPSLFSPQSITPETAAMNADILAKMSVLPDIWAFPPEVIREARRAGRGPFPISPRSPRARILTIEGKGGPLALRIVSPEQPKGVYLHLHGGGWVLGQADFQDGMLEKWASEAGLACVSVEYRLAPEHPWPAGPDDCETAALWLVAEGPTLFGTDRYFIGGESAGGNLSVVTLLRLRDRHGLTPFRGANLIAGCYDLGLTPSARQFGSERLILTTRDIRLFVKHYLAKGENPSAPDISPLYADLRGMPPALFSVGTRDPLIDDSLFMAARWEAAGHQASLKIWPGGCHVFQGFDFPLTDQAFAAERAFIEAL